MDLRSIRGRTIEIFVGKIPPSPLGDTFLGGVFLFFSSPASRVTYRHRRLGRCFRQRRRRRRPVTAISPKTSSRSPGVLPFRLLAAGDVPRVSPPSPRGFPCLSLLPVPSVFFLRAPFLPPSHNVALLLLLLLRRPPRTLPVKERTFFCFLSREILDGHDDNVGFAADSRSERKRERERYILYFRKDCLQCWMYSISVPRRARKLR